MSIHNDDIKPQYKLFAEKFLVCNNATQAAIQAGYSVKSARNQGSKLRNREDVKGYLDRLREPLTKETGQSSTAVVEALTETIKRCMQQVPVADKLGKQVFKPDENGNMVPAMVSIDTNGANKALELLGKHFGTFDPYHRNKEDIPYFAGLMIQIGPKVVQLRGEWLPKDGPTNPEDIAYIKKIEDKYAARISPEQLAAEHKLLNLEGENWPKVAS